MQILETQSRNIHGNTNQQKDLSQLIGTPELSVETFSWEESVIRLIESGKITILNELKSTSNEILLTQYLVNVYHV